MADEFWLKIPDFHVTFRDLLHALNLRHGTDGFTSSPKEGVLRIFFALKNPTASVVFEPASFGTKSQHAVSTMLITVFNILIIIAIYYHYSYGLLSLLLATKFIGFLAKRLVLFPNYKFVCQPCCSVAECRKLIFARFGLCIIHVKITKSHLISSRVRTYTVPRGTLLLLPHKHVVFV